MSPPRKTDTERLADAQDIIRNLQAQVTQLNKTLKNFRHEEMTAAIIREEIFKLASHSPDPPAWLVQPKGGGVRGIPTTIWSDWHMGEVVSREQTNGLNEFNVKIAKMRAKRLVDTTIELAFEHMGRAKYEYPGAVVMLGGDMITGNIHPELAYTNDLTNQQAINETTDLLAACIERMAEAFGRLFIPCVIGNHARDKSYSNKSMMKNRTITSHEWVIYNNLDRYFQKSKNIQFLIPGGTDALFSVVGHRYLLTHGDANGVKGGDGIIGALGPIARGALKVHDSEAQVGRDIDTICMGHWHQRVDIEGVMVNNSFIGYNEHGRVGLRAKFSRPSQNLWFTHPRYGITARWPVYLEPKPPAVIDHTWVKWTDGRS